MLKPVRNQMNEEEAPLKVQSTVLVAGTMGLQVH